MEQKVKWQRNSLRKCCREVLSKEKTWEGDFSDARDRGNQKSWGSKFQYGRLEDGQQEEGPKR